MELLCLEKVAAEPFAIDNDPMFTSDERVLQNLYFLEKQYMPKFAYFKCVQTEITPEMRKIIAGWLLEVCEVERLEDEIFASAMNILDRFLCVVDIRKGQLQLLSCVCILLACKLRKGDDFLTVDKLVNYTDYSTTADEITAWELFVLNTLEWDILAVTPNDFLDIIMARLDARYKHKQCLIRKHAQIFITLCITDYKFAFYRPSLIAIASVRSALNGLFNRSRPVLEQIQNKSITNDLFLGVEKTISIEHNHKTKLTMITLMIEESYFRANSSKLPATNQNSQNAKPNSQKQPLNASQNNQNNGNQTKTASSQKTAEKKTVKAGKTADKKATSSAPAGASKKVESRD